MEEIQGQQGIVPANDNQGTDLIQINENLLMEVSEDFEGKKVMSVPVAELGTLGACVSSLLPVLRTVTQKTTIDMQGLYKWVNAGAGDVLKRAKNNNLWGAAKTADGASKMAQFQEAGSLTATTETITAIDPTTIMLAVALFSIEKELGNIAEMEKQILSFLENEKESEIEAAVKTLSSIISQYKNNWDNDQFIASNHKMVLDLQYLARKNMIFYQKQVEEAISKNKLLVAQNKVHSMLGELTKKFKYYRLSLYTFSLASLLEIMLSGNFKEENIVGKRDEIEANSLAYRKLYEACSVYLEKLSHSSVETNVLKGIGVAGKAVGELIGKIPYVERGQVDEFLQDKGEILKSSAGDIEKEAVLAFAKIANPLTGMFVEKMNDMVQIYNHTDRIYIDGKKIYLIAG